MKEKLYIIILLLLLILRVYLGFVIDRRARTTRVGRYATRRASTARVGRIDRGVDGHAR